MNVIDRIKGLRQAYINTFQSQDGEIVYDDMFKRFDNNVSTYTGSTNDMLIKEGQRQVMLHIRTMMNLSNKAIIDIQEQIEDSENEYIS